MKYCPGCKEDLNLDKFYTNSRTPDGFAYTCKLCIAKYSAQYRKSNKNKVATNKKKWYADNKESVLDYAKSYYENNKEKVVKRVVSYRKRRLASDPIFKLQKNLRHRVSKLLKQQSSKIAINYLGCSLDELKEYLTSKFQPGMSWDNYGEWHVDHVKPLCSFNLLNEEESRLACHYTNLQPLWAKQNLSKGKGII